MQTEDVNRSETSARGREKKEISENISKETGEKTENEQNIYEVRQRAEVQLNPSLSGVLGG